jgi:ABC-type branched-subunit amino acid transport system substrate-binding protein
VSITIDKEARVNRTPRSLLALLFSGLFVLAAVGDAVAQPAGAPVRVGSTLALTGPLAATALVHKIAGEISIEQINKRNGLLGRPVEWVLLDDQSKPDVTRTLYERLITVDKVDLIMGPYATGAILSAMGVAQRYSKLLIHHSFGIPKLATYAMQFPASPLSHDPDKVVPNKLIDALESTAKPPKTIAVVTSKFPSVHFISLGARDVAATRGLKVALFLEYEFGNRDFAPIAARIKEADPDFLWMGSIGLDSNLLLDALTTIGYKPRGQFHLFPSPGPLLTAPGSASSFAFTTFEAHPPMTANKDAELLSKLFEERAKKAGLPYTLAETQAAGSFAAWQLLESAVNATKSLDDKALAGWLKANTVETVMGKVEFGGANNYGREQVKVKQIQNGRWVIVWPRDVAAPGAKVVYPTP